MTNTLNTPIEALEAHYPLRVTEYRIRRGSGGSGKHRGGDGLIREIECLVDSSVSILSERRQIAPWGLASGGDGARGVNWLIHDGKRTKLAAKTNVQLGPGDRIRIETPGGGGFGAAS
jgi:N-methylhydantoinase B